ncbi:MAG: DUF3108 domain-containing protein [Burkholderiaceae bacterium]
MLTHLLNRTRTDTDNERPRSWWSTALSLTIHGTIIALLWSAPSLPINTPEVAPPESIDATILPPPPAEKLAEKPDTPPTPSTPAATPSAHSAPSAPSTPSAPKSASDSANSADKLSASADGTQAAGAGKSDTAQADKGNGGAKKPLPSGAPVAVEPSGGFQIDYDLDASGANNAAASGGARLVFSRKGDRYVADLSAKASTLFLTAKINGHSEGQVRNNTLATEKFTDSIDLPRGKWDKQSSFVVNYDARQVTFTNKGNTFERTLEQDALFDYVSAMAYLQAGFQQGQLSAGQGAINLPIGKREEVAQARITIGDYERISTKETSAEAIPTNIAINSGSIKFIRVWFVPDKKYLPLKMEIGVDDKTIVLLSRSSG